MFWGLILNNILGLRLMWLQLALWGWQESHICGPFSNHSYQFASARRSVSITFMNLFLLASLSPCLWSFWGWWSSPLLCLSLFSQLLIMRKEWKKPTCCPAFLLDPCCESLTGRGPLDLAGLGSLACRCKSNFTSASLWVTDAHHTCCDIYVVGFFTQNKAWLFCAWVADRLVK